MTAARSVRRLSQIRDRHPVWAMEGVRETQQPTGRVRKKEEEVCSLADACVAGAAEAAEAADANQVFVGEKRKAEMDGKRPSCRLSGSSGAVSARKRIRGPQLANCRLCQQNPAATVEKKVMSGG